MTGATKHAAAVIALTFLLGMIVGAWAAMALSHRCTFLVRTWHQGYLGEQSCVCVCDGLTGDVRTEP